MTRVILASNRLPISLAGSGDQQRVVRSSGGLIAGLGPVHDEGGLWVGALGAELHDHTRELCEAERYIPVNLNADDIRGHYEGYSNSVLWPLFHYLLDHVDYRQSDYDAYRRVNEAFAQTVIDHYQMGDTIWVHDYQLMLLPSLLRAALPEAKIGFFLHIPFPSSEILKILPQRRDILEGLLGANLLGLHTYDYARHLESAFRRFADVDFDDRWVKEAGGRCSIGVFPLGVEFETFDKRARSLGVQNQTEALLEGADDRKVILSVDRLDYTKGIPERLRAFETFLTKYPELRDKVLLFLLVVPSRTSIASYQHLKNDVEQAVGRMVGVFASGVQSPIRYLYRSVSPETLVALYRSADVMWVSPLRDGMNLVAKEYVASRVDEDGVLLLSEFAGAAAEMGEAVSFNPFDPSGAAEALHRALSLEPEDVHTRMQALRKRGRRNNVHLWVTRFLKRLDALTEGHIESEQSTDDALMRISKASKARLFLDYDGTLAELVSKPSDAKPSERTVALLKALRGNSKYEVIVSSGRDLDTLNAWLGDLNLHLVAEHGRYIQYPDGRRESLGVTPDLSWMEPVGEVMQEYASLCTGAEIESKQTALVWHYRNAEPAFGAWQAQALLQHLRTTFANAAVQILSGAKIIEARPQGMDKGSALRTLRQVLGPVALEVALGDDRTDEDMFAAVLDEGVAIKVGPGESRAPYRLNSVEGVREFLQRLLR